MQKQLNWKYSASQALNSGLLAAMLAFASIFMLDKGLTNSTIGIILALSNVLSIAVQTFFANYTNRNKSVKLQDMLTVLLLVVIVSSALLLFIPSFAIFLLSAILAFSFVQSSTPFVNSLAFIYEEEGIHIKYGIARGFGSLSYALITLLLGFVIEKTSSSILPVFYMGLAFIFILVVRSYKLPKHELAIEEVPEQEEQEMNHQRESVPVSEQSLMSFLSEYRELVYIIIGLGFVLFAQTMINTFLINIVTPLGGDSSAVGLAIFIAAAVEIPIMMNFDWLVKKRSTAFWLKLSAIFFVAKVVLMFFATNLTMIYISQFLQFGSYALAYPAAVQYIKNKVHEKDLFKGQTLFTIGITASNVFASFLGGMLIDSLGTGGMVFVSLIATVIGGLIIVKVLGKVPSEAYEVAKSEA